MFARFFIDRPIFAAVISILITLAGGLSVLTLPIAQFPRITPPTVSVTCNYPGASAKDVSEAVAAPLEKEINGVEGMMYMSSSSTNDGTYNLTVTFHQGVNADLAQVMVQNRVGLALNKLPDVIKATGVTTRKRSPDILMGISINSPKGRYDQLYLSNYATRNVRDELSRVEGVGDVFLFGQRDYAMRIWVNPDLLAARNLTPADVVSAVRDENAEVAAGKIGQSVGATGRDMSITLDAEGRLDDVEQFKNIIVRVDPQGRITRVRDVARVELGARNQDTASRLDGKQTVFCAIFQRPDANALETAERVKAKMRVLQADFPEDLMWEVGFETTPYTEESIKEVIKTLQEAIILVALVVLLFLQNWRTALIPLTAVPVAIVGTFAVMALMGFSLNNLTLFGLVLAIGIVVDDAIVVVEAVEHHIEHGLSPRDATVKAMDQVAGPVIAVGLVLSAVFVPCAFITGITGLFFRQFALTIAVSTLISAINSLTLSPALCALLLKPRDKWGKSPLPWLAYPLLGAIIGYLKLSGAAAQYVPGWAATAAAAGASAAAGLVLAWPLNFVLKWLFRGFNLAFRLTTNAYTRTVAGLLRVAVIVLVVYGGLLGVTWFGFERTPRGFIPSQDMGYLMVAVQLPDAASTERTDEVMRQIEKIAINTPGVRHVTGIVGQSFALNATGPNFGSMFINLQPYPERRTLELYSDAILGRLMGAFSQIPDAMIQVFPPPPVRGVGRAGGFAFVVEDRGDVGPNILEGQTDNIIRQGTQQPGLQRMFTAFRANVPQLHVQANADECAAKGVSIDDANNTLRIYQGSMYVNDFNKFGRTWQVVVQADAPFRIDAAQLARLKVRSAKGAMVPLGSVVDIKERNGPLVLTRYNMYPAATINGSAAPGVSSGQAIDIMQQMAIVLVGLACKNAILIVEYAKAQRDAGMPTREATLEACKLRLRPIMMTSFAFILGVVPLMISEGAGAEMRRTLGVAVFAGMLGVTLFGIFMTPVFYYVIQWVNDHRVGALPPNPEPEPERNGALNHVPAHLSPVAVSGQERALS